MCVWCLIDRNDKRECFHLDLIHQCTSWEQWPSLIFNKFTAHTVHCCLVHYDIVHPVPVLPWGANDAWFVKESLIGWRPLRHLSHRGRQGSGEWNWRASLHYSAAGEITHYDKVPWGKERGLSKMSVISQTGTGNSNLIWFLSEEIEEDGHLSGLSHLNE